MPEFVVTTAQLMRGRRLLLFLYFAVVAPIVIQVIRICVSEPFPWAELTRMVAWFLVFTFLLVTILKGSLTNKRFLGWLFAISSAAAWYLVYQATSDLQAAYFVFLALIWMLAALILLCVKDVTLFVAAQRQAHRASKTQSG